MQRYGLRLSLFRGTGGGSQVRILYNKHRILYYKDMAGLKQYISNEIIKSFRSCELPNNPHGC